MVFFICLVSLDERLSAELGSLSPNKFLDAIEENPELREIYSYYLFQLASLDFFDDVKIEAEKRGYSF